MIRAMRGLGTSCLLAAVLLLGCVPGPTRSEPYVRLATDRHPDAGVVEDAGAPPVDAGEAHDAGQVADTGPAADAGFEDAAVPVDAGLEDAGVPEDAGLVPDAGPPADGGVITPPVGCEPPAGAAVAGALYLCECGPGADPGCQPGDDARAGSSAATAKRSLDAARVALNDGPGGTEVYLCRGGAWSTPDGLNLRMSSRCSAGQPCVLADYGDRGRAAPRIVVEATSNTGVALDPSMDGVLRGGYVIRNLHVVRAAGGPTEGFGLFVFRGVQDVLLSCLEVEGFGIGIQVSGNGQDLRRVRLQDSELHHNSRQGWLGGCSDCVVTRNRFHHNGRTGLQHNIYLTATGMQPAAATGMVVTENHVTANALDPVSGKCVGSAVIAHGGTFEDLLIEGNVVEEPIGVADLGCWGITVDNASGGADAHHRAVIRANVLRDMGNLSIGISACQDCVIEDNVIVQRNIGGYGIRVPDRANLPPDLPMQRVTVRNNTVWFSGYGGGTGISVGGEGQGHVVASNLVVYERPTPTLTCFEYTLGAGAFALVEANLAFNCGVLERGTLGLDARLLEADPGFVAAPDDLHLSPGSPARDSGSVGASSPRDHEGRPRDATPDRGAYEGGP
jgi:hypothetical protein